MESDLDEVVQKADGAEGQREAQHQQVVVFPFFMAGMEPRTTRSAVGTMNMMPPMVGVPDLTWCHLGPISRMDWPAFRAWRAGIRKRPRMAVRAKLTSSVTMIPMDIPFRPAG